MSCNIRACKGSAWSSIFSGSELIWQYWWTCCFGKGWGNTETQSKLFSNHNALGQLTNHNTFSFSEGGPSLNPELIEPFVSGWGERYCNNVNYVKNNVTFEPPSMRACSSTPPKQNQDFVKEHNRTPLQFLLLALVLISQVRCTFSKLLVQKSKLITLVTQLVILSKPDVMLLFSCTYFQST